MQGMGKVYDLNYSWSLMIPFPLYKVLKNSQTLREDSIASNT